MNIERRGNFKSWFTDVGFLYVIVIVAVGLIFFLKDLKDNLASIGKTIDETKKFEWYYDDKP